MKKPGLHYLNKVVAAIKEKIKGGSAITESDLDEIVKKSRAHAGGKTKSENMKAATAALVAFEQKFLADEGDAGGNRSGLMVGFFLSPDTAAQLAIPQGEALEDLHLTLCYLGDSSQFNELAIADILVACRNQAQWQTPLAGEISGTGRFIGDSEADVYYASVDIPGLNEYRTDLARRLASCGTPAKMEHGFDPHITLAYLEKDDPTPDYDMSNIELRFDTLTVMIGNKRIDMPLMASMFHEVADLCNDKSGRMRLFIEQPQKFAEPPASINFMPKPGVYTSPRFGEITITRERNQRFVDNFAAGVYQKNLPIDCEHDLEKSGASGWINLLTLNDDGSIDAGVEWTDRGRYLIENDRFKYFSPAWFNSWTKPEDPDTQIKDVAIGGALTTQPFFKENNLQPLVASEQRELTGVAESVSAKAGEATQIIFSPLTRTDAGVPAPSSEGASAMTQAAATGAQPNVTELQTRLAAAEQTAKDEKARADAAEQKLTAATTASEEATTLKEQVNGLKGEVASLRKTERTQRFTEMARKWPGERAGHIKMLEFLATATEKGEESEEFKAYATQQDAVTAQMHTAGTFSELGSTAPAAGSAYSKVEAKARKMSDDSDGKVTFEQAIQRVLEAEPQLYKEYRAEQQGGAPATIVGAGDSAGAGAGA